MLSSEAITLMRGRRDDDAVASAALLRYLNQAHLDFCGRKDWTWLLREFLFTTSAPLACSASAASGNVRRVTRIFGIFSLRFELLTQVVELSTSAM